MPAFTAHLLEVLTIPATEEKRKRRRLIRRVAFGHPATEMNLDARDEKSGKTILPPGQTE